MDLEISARGAKVIATSYACLSFAIIFVALRLTVRWKVVGVNGKEDSMLCLALITAALATIFFHLQVIDGGLGHHFDTLGPEPKAAFFRYSYFCIMFYNFSLSFTKLAIVLLCMRVFSTSSWNRACIVVLWIIGAYSAYILVVSIAPCIPIPRYWDKSVEGWCFPTPILWWFNAGMNIFTDCLVVFLPIPAVLKLQLPRAKRIGISMIFALGFSICILSIIRLKPLHLATSTTDPTFDNIDIAIWSVIEVNGAIVGACLPTLRPLVTRMFPHLMSSHDRSKTSRSYTMKVFSTPRRTNRSDLDTISETAIIGNESRIGNSDDDVKGKEGIFVTREVRVEDTTVKSSV